MAENGPWFLDLDSVLKRRDQYRYRLWRRQEVKRATRDGCRSEKRNQPLTNQANDKSSHEQAERAVNSTDVPSSSSHAQYTDNIDPDLCPEYPARASTPNLPSSDLLRCIHHEAMSFYKSRGVLALPKRRPGRLPVPRPEPIAMARAFDGSALMAIGVLLEEITKDQVENKLKPLGNAGFDS